MDERLKELTQLLGHAIDEAINESPRVKEITERLRAAGYETILMVEANICFARIAVSNSLSEEDRLAGMMSAEDHRFLRSLKIRLEDEA